MDRMRLIASDEGMSIEEVPKDGDCMFSAISDQLTRSLGSFISAREVRRQIVDYIRSVENDENESEEVKHRLAGLRDKWHGSLDGYLGKMSKMGEWGDGTMLEFAGLLYKRQILLYCSNSGRTTATRLLPDSYPEANALRLGYIDNNHYVSLVLKPDSNNTNQQQRKEEEENRRQQDIRAAAAIAAQIMKFVSAVDDIPDSCGKLITTIDNIAIRCDEIKKKLRKLSDDSRGTTKTAKKVSVCSSVVGLGCTAAGLTLTVATGGTLLVAVSAVGAVNGVFNFGFKLNETMKRSKYKSDQENCLIEMNICTQNLEQTIEDMFAKRNRFQECEDKTCYVEERKQITMALDDLLGFLNLNNEAEDDWIKAVERVSHMKLEYIPLVSELRRQNKSDEEILSIIVEKIKKKKNNNISGARKSIPRLAKEHFSYVSTHCPALPTLRAITGAVTLGMSPGIETVKTASKVADAASEITNATSKLTLVGKGTSGTVVSSTGAVAELTTAFRIIGSVNMAIDSGVLIHTLCTWNEESEQTRMLEGIIEHITMQEEKLATLKNKLEQFRNTLEQQIHGVLFSG